jgi:hypothetical protein
MAVFGNNQFPDNGCHYYDFYGFVKSGMPKFK